MISEPTRTLVRQSGIDERSPDTQQETRPWRVATFGLGARYRRLLSVIARHAGRSPHRFELTEHAGPGEFDIAIVDMTARGGSEVARTLRQVPSSMPVIQAGRREAVHPRGRDDLLFNAFAGQALGVLNDAAGSIVQRRALRGRSLPEVTVLRRLEPMGRTPRVLVVDENRAVREQISLVLRHMGVDVEGVGTLAQAEDVLSARSYDLMVLEQVQPDGNGLDLVRKVRRGGSGSRLPMVMLSHRHGFLDLCRGAMAGCDGYLAKPVAMNTMYSTVHRLLSRNQAAHRSSADSRGSAAGNDGRRRPLH